MCSQICVAVFGSVSITDGTFMNAYQKKLWKFMEDVLFVLINP